ncbi:MAG: hypothetical protein ABWX61_10955 [Paenisporosarcina sp.]
MRIRRNVARISVFLAIQGHFLAQTIDNVAIEPITLSFERVFLAFD